MSGKVDDELARTATAVGTGTPAPRDAVAAGATLGRYRLERELGAGGMGVVHAAFDPDLERRVALKVLRSVEGGDASRARLLREARAMARLSHPNVITVHEVGSAAGRDFVAMELIDGQTLAEWLRAEPRSEADILEAFIGAAKGLAAAHAADIVHRDFKPHNVLRSRQGKIVVTDFGLARSTEGPDPGGDPMAETTPMRAGTGAIESSASPLAGLTQTGTLLGTPAYMAPEQWRGTAVSPATDQFAYCVALWEALAGKRPFEGTTVEALRTAIESGPAALDASKLPRRLRAPILRGLAVDPAQRFPSMNALIAAIERPARRSKLPYAIGGVLLAGVLAIAIVAATRAPAQVPLADTCEAPVIDPAAVWSQARHDALLARKQPEAARALARDHADWLAQRTQVCALPSRERGPRLRCLDAVLARMDAIAAGVEALPPGSRPIEVTGELVAPVVCSAERAPELEPITPAMRDVLAVRALDSAEAKHVAPAVSGALVARVRAAPCAAAVAHVIDANAHDEHEAKTAALAAAEAALVRCDDQRAQAEVAIGLATASLNGLRPDTLARLRTAEAAVARVAQPELTGILLLFRAQQALMAGNLDESIARTTEAIARFRERDVVAYEALAIPLLYEARNRRRTPADLAAIEGEVQTARDKIVQRLGPEHPALRPLDIILALHQISRGDMARVHRDLAAIWRPKPIDGAVPVTGQVVDRGGRPVAGARVAVGTAVVGTSETTAELLPQTPDLRVATTDADGRFAIADAPPAGVAVAEHDGQRAMPVRLAASVRLVLQPTARVRGTLDLGSEPAASVLVAAVVQEPPGLAYQVIAHVQADGTFEISGVPRAKLRLFVALAAQAQAAVPLATVDTTRGDVAGLRVALPAMRGFLHVVVRSLSSDALPNARVWIFEGKLTRPTFKDLSEGVRGQHTQLAYRVDEQAPAAVRALAKSGDLYATLPRSPPGVFSACAVGLPSDVAADLDRQLSKHPERVRLECVPVTASDAVVIPTPPWPRLD